MATTAAPYGARPVGSLSCSGSFTGKTRNLPIITTYGTQISYGDFCKVAADGTIAKDTGTTATTAVGIFLGCSYTDPTTNQKTFSKKQYPKQKTFHQNKIPNSKARIPPRIIQKPEPKVIRNEKENIHQKVSPSSSGFTESKGSLSMLDQLNPEKYAPQNQKSEEKYVLENDEPIPLDTKEEKYVSYFSRIKHQIQRAWIYPSQGSKKLTGELTLKFEISKHGNLLSLRLISTSGSNLLDANAIKAVKNAAPYYPFPITIKKKKLSILATFVYSAN